jgi:hypothetical protein
MPFWSFSSNMFVGVPMMVSDESAVSPGKGLSAFLYELPGCDLPRRKLTALSSSVTTDAWVQPTVSSADRADRLGSTKISCILPEDYPCPRNIRIRPKQMPPFGILEPDPLDKPVGYLHKKGSPGLDAGQYSPTCSSSKFRTGCGTHSDNTPSTTPRLWRCRPVSSLYPRPTMMSLLTLTRDARLLADPPHHLTTKLSPRPRHWTRSSGVSGTATQKPANALSIPTGLACSTVSHY